MNTDMGKLYELLERHMNEGPYPVSQRQVARRLGVSPTTLRNWQDPTNLIAKTHLVAIARLTHVPYHRVLDALLDDIGYLSEDDQPNGPRQSTTG